MELPLHDESRLLSSIDFRSSMYPTVDGDDRTTCFDFMSEDLVLILDVRLVISYATMKDLGLVARITHGDVGFESVASRGCWDIQSEQVEDRSGCFSPLSS
ncbi:hypothetical protein U1Q18_010904 [Sarracenia purpurea var. burkii]